MARRGVPIVHCTEIRMAGEAVGLAMAAHFCDGYFGPQNLHVERPCCVDVEALAARICRLPISSLNILHQIDMVVHYPDIYERHAKWLWVWRQVQ